MNAVILLPDGVGVRNMILGPFLKLASKAGSACVLHPITAELMPRYQAGLNGSVRWEPLLRYRETAQAATLRYALAYAQMYWGQTKAMRSHLNAAVGGSWRTRAMRKAAQAIGRVSANPRGIAALGWGHSREVSRVPEVAHYRKLFQDIRPTVLFCSHQRPLHILPPVLAARSLGIPTATFIFSWDNLTSKGRIAAPFDHFLVWSELMRSELLKYYPDVHPDRVHVVGTPQFDPYADLGLLWSREEFFRRVGADLNRPLVCYSGGDIITCPEDHFHIRILMEQVRTGRIRGNPQILLRPAPVDEGSRYDQVRRDFPELIYARPDWVHTVPDDWSLILPLPGDVQFLANVTQHSDLNINMASTMTLDFAIHDRPVVNIAFDVNDPPPHGEPLWRHFYEFEHYRPVVELGAARFARTADEMAEHVNTYLENPSLDKDARRKFVELEVALPFGHSSELIVQTLEKIGKAG